MDLAHSISGLLTWKWVVLILALSFHRSLRKLIDKSLHGLIDRLVSVSLVRGDYASGRIRRRKWSRELGRVKETAPQEPVHKNLEAHQFTLQDEHGNRRAVLA